MQVFFCAKSNRHLKIERGFGSNTKGDDEDNPVALDCSLMRLDDSHFSHSLNFNLIDYQTFNKFHHGTMLNLKASHFRDFHFAKSHPEKTETESASSRG
jgi:hypothetical protein